MSFAVSAANASSRNHAEGPEPRNPRPHVLLANSVRVFAGAERFALDAALGLAGRGYPVTVQAYPGGPLAARDAERELLEVLVTHPEAIPVARSRLQLDLLRNADVHALVERLFDLDGYNWGDRDATLSLTESPLLQGMRVPSRTTNPHFCPFTFKGAECGYVGSLTTCNYSFEDCRERFGTDPKRFGGFLGKPKQSLGWF